MKTFTTILLTALLSGTAMAGYPTRTLANHTIVPMTYTGPITPGGEHITFTGHSIQDIHLQILALNPDFKLSAPAASSTPLARRNKVRPHLALSKPSPPLQPNHIASIPIPEKRYPFTIPKFVIQKNRLIHRVRKQETKSLICDIPGRLSETAETVWIRDGISYLKGLEGTCGVSAGPAACARISCSYDSGIYLCNDVRLSPPSSPFIHIPSLHFLVYGRSPLIPLSADRCSIFAFRGRAGAD
ncbi:hypothetical protein BO70DRAFT_358131 [Aspergillus heteromorphus CBS 117.55]|uniref:Ig-like domain-containing protein n=1 Tax=Aspergillus heteromorphus CBS 117.55 TaxID=1448321 RepID=A0A317WXQ7_9EURO|nr:uncharacterized protein BO70DRAFT_358131 [Aspergillus heteromorphus CBS 117.55]PWY90681.1 hypothetical protein BO70DRAFT_358131 [Aspergillus heteromorphus CBS 117.55]